MQAQSFILILQNTVKKVDVLPFNTHHNNIRQSRVSTNLIICTYINVFYINYVHKYTYFTVRYQVYQARIIDSQYISYWKVDFIS